MKIFPARVACCLLHRPFRAASVSSVPSVLNPPPRPRSLHGTVVEQCSRKEPAFSDSCSQTLFHRFQILFFVRPVIHLRLTPPSDVAAYCLPPIDAEMKHMYSCNKVAAPAPFPMDSSQPNEVSRIIGRGSQIAPPNRFESVRLESDWEQLEHDDQAADDRRIATQFFADATQSLITSNDSPDIPFTYSINPYRGCEHGCAYCYARPGHEFLGLSAGLDFETQIFVKEYAPELLRRELLSPNWVPQMVAIGGVTDPYQPIERRLELTRRCLQVFLEFRNPVGIVTKSALVARDRDLLGELARYQASAVYMSVTTLDPELARKMEPRAAMPAARLRAIRELT